MAVVFLLAHFDDEYCATPLILEARSKGEACWFLYVADYRKPAAARRRAQETRRFVRGLGLDPARVLHVGAGCGAWDGRVAEALESALARVREALRNIGPVTRIVTPAWEGGHPDHDCCAAMAAIVAAELGGAVLLHQFGLYNGRRFPRPFYRACSPLPENGPETRVPIGAGAWIRWIAAVGCFPSQTWNWLGLWPSMFMTFATRGGFAFQALDPARILERPHAGRLHYEWMFKTPYARVRAAVDEALAQSPGRATIMKKPATISP